jgi:hypothetical protein
MATNTYVMRSFHLQYGLMTGNPKAVHLGVFSNADTSDSAHSNAHTAPRPPRSIAPPGGVL